MISQYFASYLWVPMWISRFFWTISLEKQTWSCGLGIIKWVGSSSSAVRPGSFVCNGPHYLDKEIEMLISQIVAVWCYHELLKRWGRDVILSPSHFSLHPCTLLSGFLCGGAGEPAGDPQQAAAAVSVPHGAVCCPDRWHLLSSPSLRTYWGPFGKSTYGGWLRNF